MSGKVGAPPLWGSEAAMFAIWRLVRVEIDYRGAKGVRAACRAIMERSNEQIRLVKVKPEHESLPRDQLKKEHYDLLSRELMSINDSFKEEALRQRFIRADQNRLCGDKFPILAQRTAIYFEALEQDKLRLDGPPKPTQP
jgi:hypothetical protein